MQISRGLIASFIVVLGVSGCGGNDDKKSGGATIGYAFSITGPNAQAAVPIDNSVQIALKEVNAAGGVLGGDLVLDLKDDESDPTATADIGAQFLAENRTIILGPMTTAGAVAMLPATVPAGTLVISPATTGVALSTYADNDLFFRTVASTATEGIAVAHYAYQQGFRRIGVISQVDGYPRDYADTFSTEFTSLGGTVTTPVYFQGTVGAAYDYQADLTTVYATTPDAIFLSGLNGPTESYLKAHAASPTFTGPFYLSDANSIPQVEVDVGASVEGDGGGEFLRPNNDEWNYFAGQYNATYSAAPGPRSGESYDALALLALAIERAGTTDASAVRDALREVSSPPGVTIEPGDLAHGLALAKAGTDINYEGAASNDDFDSNGDVLENVAIWDFAGGAVTVVETGTITP